MPFARCDHRRARFAYEWPRLANVRARAVTMGQIADILGARSELDEALRIRREEELSVYEHLGPLGGHPPGAGRQPSSA